MTTETAAASAAALSPADGITLQRIARAGGYTGPMTPSFGPVYPPLAASRWRASQVAGPGSPSRCPA